jgi:hypothetical protein
MDKAEMRKNPAACFAALKLIEQLYRDGEIPAHVFRNILHEYSDIVNISEFTIANHNEK